MIDIYTYIVYLFSIIYIYMTIIPLLKRLLGFDVSVKSSFRSSKALPFNGPRYHFFLVGWVGWLPSAGDILGIGQDSSAICIILVVAICNPRGTAAGPGKDRKWRQGA